MVCDIETILATTTNMRSRKKRRRPRTPEYGREEDSNRAQNLEIDRRGKRNDDPTFLTRLFGSGGRFVGGLKIVNGYWRLFEQVLGSS